MGKIEFVSTIEGLDLLEECKPKPAKHYIPKWFKDIPSDIMGTVKRCPSFPDYFSQGYVLPMWADSVIKYDQENQEWEWYMASKNYIWEIHSNSQFIDYKIPSLMGIDASFIFKPVSPWRVITPKGWSVLQLPLFYNFNKKWSVLPGVIDTDIHNEINPQVLYHGNGEEVLIQQGEPLCLYIPFERKSKLKLHVHEQNKKNKKLFQSRDLRTQGKFPNSGYYRKLQRDRDNDE